MPETEKELGISGGKSAAGKAGGVACVMTCYPGPAPALSKVRTHRPLTGCCHSCHCFCFVVLNAHPFRQPSPKDSRPLLGVGSRGRCPWRQDGSRPQRSPRPRPPLKDGREGKQWWCPAHEPLWVWGTSLKAAEQGSGTVASSRGVGDAG